MDFNFKITTLLMLFTVIVFITGKVLEGIWSMFISFYNRTSNSLDLAKEAKFIEKRILKLPTVDRVIFYHYHDSGNILTQYSPLKVTALWGNPDSIRDLRGIDVDYNYLNLLMEAKQRGYADFDVQSSENCFLKNIYKAESINSSRIYFVNSKNTTSNPIYKLFNINKTKGLFYLSVASKNGYISEEDDLEIKKYVEQLKRIYK